MGKSSPEQIFFRKLSLGAPDCGTADPPLKTYHFQLGDVTNQWGRRILINDQRLFLLTDQMIYKTLISLDELIIIASFHNVMSRGTLPYLEKRLCDNDNNNKKVFMIKKSQCAYNLNELFTTIISK